MSSPGELTDEELFAQGYQQARPGEMSDADLLAIQVKPLPLIPGSQASPYYPGDADKPNAGQWLNDRARAFARGVPVLGALADEGDAATNAALAPVLQPLLQKLPGYDHATDLSGDFGQRYQQSLAMQRGMDTRFDTSNPDESRNYRIAGTVGGVLAGARALAPFSSALGTGAHLAARVGTGVLDGSLIGGLQGAANGEGGITDQSRIDGMKKDALIGGLFGGALPIAGAGVKGVWDATGRKALDAMLGPATLTKAQKTLSELLQQTPDATPEAVDAAAARTAVPGTTASQSQAAGAYDRIARELERQGLSPAEAMKRARELGPYGTLADVGEGTRDLARTAANTPGPAGQIAKDALDLRQRGVLKNGEFTVRPSSARVTDEAATGLGVGGKDYLVEADALTKAQKAAAAPAYAKAYEAPPVSIGDLVQGTETRVGGDLSQFANSPIFRQAYNRARKISQAEFVKTPDDVAKWTGEAEQIKPLPANMPSKLDWRTVDLVKQGLDDMIATGRQEGIGATEQGAMKGYLKRLVGKLDELNPDYKAARDAFAGPARMKDAMEEGRGFLREDAGVTAKSLQDLTQSEREAFRIGALQALKDKLGNADVTYDAARSAGFLKPNQLERFKALFPDQETFATFANKLGNEQRMFETRGAVLGNSSTAKQLARADDAGENPLGSALDVAANLKTGGLHGVAQMGARILSGGGKKLDEGTSKALAAILLDMNPANWATTLKGLTEAEKRRLTQALWKGTGQAGAAQGGVGFFGDQR